jgi:hypothetical protein
LGESASRKDQARLVNSLYKAAFGRLAEPEGLENRIHQLQSGGSLEMSDPPKLDAIAPYSRWIALNDTISDSDRAAISAHIPGLPFRALISVMMPIGKASQSALRESFHSVIKPLYPDWELCIAVDAITEPLWTAMLPDRATNDPRIRVIRLGSIESTAAATNAALDLANGEFVAFLRIGDLLPEHPLYEVAIEIAANPCADVIYSDNDQICAAGQRVNPWFKPGWDPDLLLAQHYISDLAVSLALDRRDTFERSSRVCAGAVAASRTRVDRGWMRKSRSAIGGLNLESECRAMQVAKSR